MTYTIIGGDSKEYGSVSADDVRQWIAEGRLNEKSQVKGEGDAEFRALEQFPEFADAFAAAASAPGTPPPSGGFPAAAGNDYELDIGGCVSRGWNLYKENFGVLFIACLLMFAMEIVFMGVLNLLLMPLAKNLVHAPIGWRLGYNYLITAITSLVVGPMAGGVYFVFLKVIRQQDASVGDVFAGFQRAFAQLYLGALVVGLVVGACLMPFQFVWQAKAGPLLEQLQLAQMQHPAPADLQNTVRDLLHASAGALPVLFVCLIPMTYLTVSWGFTLPLIIDRQMNFWPAMKTSFRQVNKHWWQIFGLTVLVGLVSAAGLLGCCIGIIFTAPIGIAAMMLAYETIFSASGRQNA
jgi:uncharacterized membrane protein